MTSKTTEDYLKAIYQARCTGMQRRGEPASLAERLGVAPASVTGMLKKLAAQDLVTYTRYQGVVLTAAGRRHCASTWCAGTGWPSATCSDVLGLSWDRVHAEAEEWEHVLSRDVATAHGRGARVAVDRSTRGADPVDPGRRARADRCAAGGTAAARVRNGGSA